MKVNKKVFVPDLAGDVGGTPGKGIVRLNLGVSNTHAIKEPKILSNVRFNEFQTSLGATHLIDRVSPTNNYSFQRGVPDDGNRSVDIGGALTSRNIYQKPALTHNNFASADVKMVTEYVQRALSLGNKYLPARTFVELQDASALRLSVVHRERTIMLRMMVDSSRTGATTENKAVLAIADAAGSSTSYQINVQGVDGVSNGIQINSLIKAASGADNSVSTTASKIEADRWYTVFFRSSINSAGNSVNNTINVFEIQGQNEGNLIDTVTNTAAINPAVITGTPRMYIGYGELAGGVNADFRLSDFISGVHIAEFAAWKGYLASDTITQIAASHLRRNQYESGIDSRPVKRVQQIFDSMDTYPSQRKMTGKKLSANIKDSLFDATTEHTYGQLRGDINVGEEHRELMVYPEMIPARLYSGSGGTWYNGSYSPYESLAQKYAPAPSPATQRIPLKDGQYRDIRGTPFKNKLVATASTRPGVPHKETELLNKISVHDYFTTTGSLMQTVTNALGGLISPFNDNQAGDANVINEIGVPENVYPGLNQKLGDIIAIEIPIPTSDDTTMGVDSTQGRIASMAYYNFDSASWDRKFMPGISGSNVRSAQDLDGSSGNAYLGTNFWSDAKAFLINSCSIGFGGTSGFTIFTDELSNALMDMPGRGRPTSMYGFPHTDQYVAALGQTLKISDYIDGPFLLEKIAIEFEGEVEEAGPSSIATIIRTPTRWKSRTETYNYHWQGSQKKAVWTTESGVPGVGMFYRSMSTTNIRQASVNISGTGPDDTVEVAEGTKLSNMARTWGGPLNQEGLADFSTNGTAFVSTLTANAHANPYPLFIGGSTLPAYADMFDLWGEKGYDIHGDPAWSASGQDGFWGGTSTAQQWRPYDREGFQVSADRLYAIQDTSNDPASLSGAGQNMWRGYKNEDLTDSWSAGQKMGAPDFLSGVRGYYESRPSTMMYYNIPARIFLPQIERAFGVGGMPIANRGRRDGAPYGGFVKLLFGGISGLVTGSYTPAEKIEDNYYASGSDPRYYLIAGDSGKPKAPTNPTDSGFKLQRGRWYKPAYLSRNYIQFIDSFSIDATGNMTSTAGIANGSTIAGGTGNSESMTTALPLPESTGGAPFWRCDTFFLLHQKKGKIRFIGGEADIISAPEKQSFEKLQGETDAGFEGGAYQPTQNGPAIPRTWTILKNNNHQSAVLQDACSDGLRSWLAQGPDSIQHLSNRRRRIKLEESIDEFNKSTRTTNRELITYAQITHFGYAASEAVIAGNIIPAENYYASSSAVGGVPDGEGFWGGYSPTGFPTSSYQRLSSTQDGSKLLPAPRSFYSQAIKLGATNTSWTNVGGGFNGSKQMFSTAGSGARTNWTTKNRLFGAAPDIAKGASPARYLTTASDQARTQYMIAKSGSHYTNAKMSRGIMGRLSRTGSAASGQFNAMFLDPGAGSGNGLFWRFAEYDVFPENGYPLGPSKAKSYMGDQPLGAGTGNAKIPHVMRVFKWDQWFENPVYGGQRNTWINTLPTTIGQAGSVFPPKQHTRTLDGVAIDKSGGVGVSEGVPPGRAPISVLNVAHGGTSSVAGGKMNYMQIDWRYQCGTHYNSGIDSAPIGLAPGKRYRQGQWPNNIFGEEKSIADNRWWNVGGHAQAANGVPTGSQFIGSMVSSASQPWHGTAITRSGFSIITSPTTPVPSGTHPDYSKYGSFYKPGLITTQGGAGGYCGISKPLYMRQDQEASGTFSVPVQDWLGAGLSRDLDFHIGFGFKHARKDLNKGVAGFTILTASTVFPPGDLAGRFNGDHKLRATFKERRLLNAGNFRVVSDIKTQPATNTDSSALFCHTAPAKRQYLVGTGSILNSHAYNSANNRLLEFGDNSRFSNDRIWWRAYAIDSSFIGNTQAKAWESDVGIPPSIGSSPRRFTAAIAGNTPVTLQSHLLTSGTAEQLADVQIPQTAPGPGLFRASFGPNRSFGSPWAQLQTSGLWAGRWLPSTSQDGGSTILNAGLTAKPYGTPPAIWSNKYVPYTSSSLAADKPQTSLYLLMPGDEIVLGFQPSLHGSNRGNNTIPTNPNVNPYGPWRDGIVDRQGIPTGSAYSPEWNYATNQARPQIVDSRGQGGWHLRRGPNTILPDGTPAGKSINNANMESLYEPRSSFTIKKNRHAKLVLYGTLLRDNKHVSPSLEQNLRTNAVHETIMGAPIVDQYQIEPTYAYTGSYIAHHVTGNITLHQRFRPAMNLPSPTKYGFSSTFPTSLYNVSAPQYISLGGPHDVYGQHRRGVYKPNISENAAAWKGLQANYPGPDGAAIPAGSYWPKAVSTSMSMGISGSIQRFVRLLDDSEYYYDSMVPDVGRMFQQDLTVSGANAAVGCSIDRLQVINKNVKAGMVRSKEFAEPPAATIMFNFGRTSWCSTWSSPWAGNAYISATGLRDEQPFWANPNINTAFPFEHRYNGIPRVVTQSPTLGTSGSWPTVCVAASVQTYRDFPSSVLASLSFQPTGSSSPVTSIRMAGENNCREFENVSWPVGYWGPTNISPLRRRASPIANLNILNVVAFGWWKSKYSDRPLPTIGNSQPNWPQYSVNDNATSPAGLLRGSQLDHPSGWKYGLLNFRKTASSAVFRSDKYGQFRDMLEQRKYSKFYDTGDEENPSGLQEAAVSCIFLDGDGMPLIDPLQTSCLNVSQQMTSSVPYKEGETARTFLFSRQLVTISPLVQSFTASPFLSLLK